ncbi:hypothetical protein NO430_21750 (plasmid) [Xanthomonas oryzae pv. oryzae]|uniref:hypothetical protein n=1 Tax=Xanthomonas oryzae TaxID=347 RepID=UPI00217E4109|nr:hypothetical protein [Xanthomonas oryzae]UWI58961.1 hypothetical protein NO430_21750 [Xanthomonas oryzae pv. oryzae]
MRNVWMIVSGLAVVVAIGGAVYYFFPKQSAATTSNVPQLPSTDNRVLVVPAGNPLLNADKAQFRQWLPPYCGADIFLQSQPEPHKVDVCVNGTVQRVASATGIKLSRADVLDSRVRAHWREVMGAK